MERYLTLSSPETTTASHSQTSSEILFPEDTWEIEKRTPEFQSIYRQVKQFCGLLRDQRDTVEASEGRTFSRNTYDNAHRLVSAAYFLLANADDISTSGRPANIASNTSIELRAEFAQEIKAVLDSLGIDLQELGRIPVRPQG